MTTPSLILHNAKVYTVDESQPWADAIAISGSHIVSVGSSRQILAGRNHDTEILDLDGHLVLPGLCDAHIHFFEWSLGLGQLKLAGVRSKADMLDAVGSWALTREPDSWVIGRGWNETLWSDATMPTRRELDEFSLDGQPVILWRSDMHCAVANSRALSIASIDNATTDPEGGFIGHHADGEPDGRLFELAINLVTPFIPEPSPADLEDAYIRGMRSLHALGVTAIHSQRMKDQREGPLSFNTLLRLQENGALRLRVNSNIAAHDVPYLGALGLRCGFGNDYLRLGHIKLFADGTLGSRTAWMLDPLESVERDDPHAFGVCLTKPSEMAIVVEMAGKFGFPVSIHAIGDRANREVLDILEELASSAPPQGISHRIEHVQIIDPADVDRLKALNITASVQPIHALDDMEIADRLLGARSDRAYRFGTLVRSGARVVFGSDAPVADPNPFLGFHAAMFRQRPDAMSDAPWHGDERLSLEQTIYGYTLGAACAAGWHDSIGSITPGKRADLIVLDRDLFSLKDQGLNSRAIADTRVLTTIFDGEIVYQSHNDSLAPENRDRS
ncbi:MAG: amidohydrolase [Candidatus Promineifilaceae bacterium]